MAIYRQVHTTFWSDAKVLDDMTPEDKYFYLYLLTNPYTRQCGCYEISKRQMSNETGYNMQTIERLIKRFEQNLKVIRYSETTKEIFILNWHRYNWTKSPKVRSCIIKELESIKSPTFKQILYTLCIDYGYPIESLCIDLGEEQEEEQEEEEEEEQEQKQDIIYIPVIDYLNLICGTNYKSTSKKTKSLIDARINEGYILEDFKKVIDVKANEWLKTEMDKFLRPETLFGTKFEGYLNQKVIAQKPSASSNPFLELLQEELEKEAKGEKN